jgi:hypothetical protein
VNTLPAAPAPATPPQVTPTPAPLTAITPTANAQIPRIVAATRNAIKRSDFATAEKAVADAERLDAKAGAEIRAELRAALDKSRAPPPLAAPLPPPVANTQPAVPPVTPPAAAPATKAAPAPAPSATNVPTADARLPQLVAVARNAIKRSDLAAAERAVAEAEKLDAKSVSVVEVRAELKLARLVEEAHDAIRQLDFTAAEKAIAEVQKLDAKAASEVHAELKAAEAKSRDKMQPINRK